MTATVSNQAYASFKPTLPKKSGVDGGANKYQHILVSWFTFTSQGGLVQLFHSTHCIIINFTQNEALLDASTYSRRLDGYALLLEVVQQDLNSL